MTEAEKKVLSLLKADRTLSIAELKSRTAMSRALCIFSAKAMLLSDDRKPLCEVVDNQIIPLEEIQRLYWLSKQVGRNEAYGSFNQNIDEKQVEINCKTSRPYFKFKHKLEIRTDFYCRYFKFGF